MAGNCEPNTVFIVWENIEINIFIQFGGQWLLYELSVVYF